MRYPYLLSILFCIFVNKTVFSQNVTSAKGYFLYPINPGKKQTLAGTMGELRSNHFHGGIDVRTDGQEGLPVLASADGYVSKIQVSTSGYGNMIYITHPNGFVTVYAHLQKFKKTIGAYTRKKQYEMHTFEMELNVPKNVLKVSKGDTIALSGNTGSSRGPHLHYEIRDTMNNVYNPLSFGFTEIADDISPVINRFALRTMDVNSRIKNAFGRFEFTPVKRGKKYVIDTPIEATGLIGVELEAHDRQNATHFKTGINCLEMQMNDIPIYFHNIETFEHDKTRTMNVHIDYSTYRKQGKYFQKCYVADGNELNFYQTDRSNGLLNITDSKVHVIQIQVWDSHGNPTTLEFKIKGTPPTVDVPKPIKIAGAKSISHEIVGNILKIVVKNYNQVGSNAMLYFKSFPYEIAVSYTTATDIVFVWDLRRAIPDSVDFCGLMEVFHFRKTIPAGSEFAYFDRNMNLFFPKGVLADTLYLQTSLKDDVYEIHNDNVPLLDDFQITLKPEKDIPNKKNTSVYLVNGGRRFLGGTWKNNQITFTSKYFGKYKLLSDNLPPTIVLKSKKPKRVVFSVSDNLSGISTFDANLNGKWVLVQYEHKLNKLFIDADEYHPLIKGLLEMVITDNSGNQRFYKTKL